MYWKACAAVTEQPVVRSVTTTSTVETTCGVPAMCPVVQVGAAVPMTGTVIPMEVDVAVLTNAVSAPIFTSAELIEAGKKTPLMIAASPPVPLFGGQGATPVGQEFDGLIPVSAGFGTT